MDSRNVGLLNTLEKRKSHRLVTPKLSPTNREVIEEAIDSVPDSQKDDLFVITSAVGSVLAHRYGSKDKETGEYYLTDGACYQLERTGMASTYDIAEKVDLYLSGRSQENV